MLGKYRNNDWIRKYKFQLILSLCLIIAPFLTYGHLFFDSNNSSFHFFGYLIDLEIIPIQTFVWILLSGFISIGILCVLFFSIASKWKYSLFLPVVIYLNDMFGYVHMNSLMKATIISIILTVILTIDIKILRKYRQRELNFKLSILILKSSISGVGEVDEKVIKLNAESDKRSNSKLLFGLYSYKIYLENFLKDNNWFSISNSTDTTTARNIYLAFLVVLSTSLWFLHYFIPEGTMNYKFGLFTITPHGFTDSQVFVWYLSRKIIVIIPMVIWFITYHSWWRYAVLSPLLLYLYQFWEAFQDGRIIVDVYGNYKVFPFVLASVLLLLTISRIVRRQSRSLDTYDQIKEEIEDLIHKIGEERSGVGDYRNRFEQIRNKLGFDSAADTNLAELIRLQQELQNKVIG